MPSLRAANDLVGGPLDGRLHAAQTLTTEMNKPVVNFSKLGKVNMF